MKLNQLVAANLRYYFRSHLGVVVGAAVSAAILVGALAVGDSVRLSLRERAMERLVGAVAVISSGDRYFDESLGRRIIDVGQDHSDFQAATLLNLPGTAVRQDATARANLVQVVGVPDGFLPGQEVTASNRVWLNESLARQLHARVGDDVVLRFHKPSALSRDAVISPRDTVAVALRLQVGGVISPRQGGDLALQASQTAPFNAFLSHSVLAAAAGLPGRANLVWFRSKKDSTSVADSTNLVQTLKRQLEAAWRLDDAELSVRPVPGFSNHWELSSRRIFIERPVAVAADSVSQTDWRDAAPLLTYLVTSISHGTNEVPYSMVTAAGAPWTPADLSEDEILVNTWLADNLKVKAGDSLKVTYFVADTGPKLSERTNQFRIRGVVPIEGIYADRSLMPEFPGIAKAESTQDWDAGFPLTRQIRTEDEAYWKKWRGVPKAFVTLNAGKRLWGNRFGEITSIRWTRSLNEARTPASPVPGSELEQILHQSLHPESMGLEIDAVRNRVLAGADKGQDFGQLFLGFSFFLLGSSLLLTTLLFRLALDRRAREIGVLLAVGWPVSRVSAVLWREGVALAAIGTVLGGGFGVLYAKGVLWGLSTLWKAAIARASLDFHLTWQTMAMGSLLSIFTAAATLALTLRTLVRRPARELLADGSLESSLLLPSQNGGRVVVGAVLSGIAGVGLTVGALFRGSAEPGIFFGAGSLGLLSGILWIRFLLGRMLQTGAVRGRTRPQMSTLAIRGLVRRPGRSLGAVVLLASAAFLLGAVGSFRLESVSGPGTRNSGTGGFCLWARSALPVLQDLDSVKGREYYGISSNSMAGVSVVPFRVRDGDDASCLNLSQAQRPRLLGVQPDLLARRGAFTFAAVGAGLSSTNVNPWMILSSSTWSGDETPAIGDAASLEWILKKQVGDTLDYTDEQGRPFKVRIVGSLEGSVLQGNLLIAESELVRRFPGETGYREFLVDAPFEAAGDVSASLSRALQDVGFEATPTWLRLAEFNAVQNTYLDTFQLLGGLGLLLGSAGFGVIVLRNLLERRGEMGLMLALGFERGFLVRMVLMENLLLLSVGLVVGVMAAMLAVLPSFRSGAPPFPWVSLGATFLLVMLNGIAWAWLAAASAMRGKLLDALRDI